MHVARNRRRYVTKGGEERIYESVLLRRSVRHGQGVGHETLANLSALPSHVIDVIEQSLKGQRLVPAAEAVTIVRSAPHGHVAAVAAMAHTLGLPALVGPACRQRDLVYALILSRVVRPASKLSTLTWWSDTTLGADLGVLDASTDEIYAAMDWLASRQDAIEAALAARHLAPAANPSRMALFDLTSAWMEGSHCPLAARGYSRDGKKGKLQIEYGILTDPEGRPVAVRVLAGDTGDPAAFTEIVRVVRERFGLTDLVMVGDRGMITKARIEEVKKLNADPDTTADFGWITALRAPTIAKLVRDGAVQLSLFDEQDLAEITHPDYPGERLIACRNPLLAAERVRKREDLLHCTQRLLDPVIAQVQAGTLHGADQIGIAVGKVINKHKVGKHFDHQITNTSLTVTRNQERIAAEAALDGIYVLRTPVPVKRIDAPAVVSAYKSLSHVERDFRIIKVDDLDLRPIYHHLDHRVRAHVLICLLACYLIWHLRQAWAPLTFTDEHPPARTNPVAPAQRSAHAHTKASFQRDQFGHPYRSFRSLLDHLATLTRNQVRFTGTDTAVPILTEPTADQREAFHLIGATIPLTLT
jgi:hypothetical protein